MKTCRLCKCNKHYPEFDKSSRYKDGHRTECKACRSAERQTEAYKSKHASYNKQYYQNGYKEYHREFYQDNNESIRARVSDYKRREDVKSKRWLRLRTDPVYRTQCWMRDTVYRCLKGRLKEGMSATLLGYTSKEFLDRFESDINAYSQAGIKYHVDHLIPLEWFKDDAPVNVMSALDNLRIIDKTTNLNKLASYADPVPRQFYDIIVEWVKGEYKGKLNYLG